MNALNDFFNNIDELRVYVPYISGRFEFSELGSSAIGARKQIRDIITKSLWNKIKGESDSDARMYLSNAFGNLTMYKSIIFNVVASRVSGSVDVYKSELETMRREYMDNYYSAMDSLIEELTENDVYSDWKNTTEYKLISGLQIKTTGEFNSFYGIDMSFLFFFRSIPLQREILLDGIADLFQKSSDRNELTVKLKLALSHLVVALALSRFDIIELPATIRNLFDEQKASRSGKDEQSRILALSSELRSKAMDTISAVELALSDPDTSNIVSQTSYNRPDDKIYLIP
jgi:hypothetical protein